VYDGKVVGNADIQIGGSSYVEEGVAGNGKFTGGTSIRVKDITFNSNVQLGGSSKITGDINSGGYFNSGTSDSLGGNIFTNDFVDLGGSTKVIGNVDAGGNVSLGTSVNIFGNLTTAGTVSIGGSSVIYGVITEHGTPQAPQSFSLITLPPATVFNSGGTNITSNATLSPGSYGSVNLGTSKTLNLSSGDYYFASFSMGGSGKLNLNVANGKIRIFITGNVTFGTSLTTTILNGGPEDVYLETHGNFQLGGSGKWSGSLYCPLGNITLGTSCIIKGALWTNGEIQIGGSTKVYYINNSLAKGSGEPEGDQEITNIIPDEISLEQNYPNPFNPTTTINYQLPEKNHVSLKVYDILGNLVSTLVDEEMEAGYYSVNWNASQLASGIYIYRIISGSYVSTKKMILMK
jgi:predicted acyltransferase (DUF342 family)